MSARPRTSDPARARPRSTRWRASRARRPGRRRRGRRGGHRARRGLPRAVDRAGRAARLRQRHQLALPKLVHGGLRYLEMFDFALVREALEERGLLLTRLAPHLVRPVPVPLPAAPHLGAAVRRRRPAAVRRDGDGRQVRAWACPRHQHLFRSQLARMAPGPAHRRAHRRDPLLRLPGRRRPAGDEHRPHGRGVRRPRRLAHQGDRRSCARATGSSACASRTSRTTASSRSAPRSSSTPPGSGPTRSRRWSAAAARSTSRPARASTSSCRATGSAARPASSPRPRSRVLFVIPWGRHWIIGTTDTPWDLDLAHPAASRADIDYVLGHVNTLLRDAARPRRRRGGVRRAAAAAPGRHRADLEDLPRAHRRRAGAGAGDDRRRQADDLPGDGAGRRRRGGRSRWRRRPVGAEHHRPGAAARRRAASRPAPTSGSRWPASSGLHVARIDHLLGRYGGLIDEVLGLVGRAARAGRAADRRRGLPRGRGRLRRHPRGRAPPRRRARPAYAHLDRDLRPRHRRRPPGRRADGRPSSAGTQARVDEEVDHYLRRVEAERQSQEKLTDQEADEARVQAPEGPWAV